MSEGEIIIVFNLFRQRRRLCRCWCSSKNVGCVVCLCRRLALRCLLLCADAFQLPSIQAVEHLLPFGIGFAPEVEFYRYHVADIVLIQQGAIVLRELEFVDLGE